MRSQKKAATTKAATKAAKPAAEPAPTTPDAESGDENQAPSTPATKTKTPRKRGTPKVANKLATSASGAGPIDVTYENDSVLATVSVQFNPSQRVTCSTLTFHSLCPRPREAASVRL